MTNLNPEQLSAVQHGTGPLRIVAHAGSGKTTALVERFAHLVEQRQISPVHLLMITFSRPAQQEMEKRINKRLPAAGAGKSARTFHSIGLMIYRKSAPNKDDFELDTGGLLFKKAVDAACKELDVPPARGAIKRFSGLVKSNLLGGDPVMRRLGRLDQRMLDLARDVADDASVIEAHTLLDVFFKVEDIRTRTGVIHDGGPVRFVTFDDMLYETALLLRRDKQVRKAWAARWQYILQDEMQDSNPAQAAIAEALVQRHRNYTVVGDPSQAVFSFRGTTPESILNFDQDYPGATTVIMHRNYRSGIEIVDIANHILDCMPADSVITDDLGGSTAMHSERQTHAFVDFHTFPTGQHEAEAIAENIRLHEREGVPWEEQAVLVRMNRMTRDIEIALATRGIPYKLISGTSFFTLREAECLLGYARVITQRASAEALTSCLRYPTRRLRHALIQDIATSPSEGEDWIDTARRVALTAKDHEYRKIDEWARFIEAERDAHVTSDKNPSTLLARLRELLKLDKWFKAESEDSEDSKSRKNLDAVVRFSDRYETVAAMLDAVDEIDAHRKRTARKRKAVVVSTCHKAKGKEWDIVYAPLLVDGLFPVGHGEVTEERRLFYVVCTRPRDELWLSSPATTDHNEKDVGPSRFISEVGLSPSKRYEIGRKIDDMRVGTQMELI